MHRLVAAGQKVPIGAAVALVAGTPEEYEALAAGSAADGDGGAENGNPFLGYIGHGGGAAVAQTAGAASRRRVRRPAQRRRGRAGRAAAPLAAGACPARAARLHARGRARDHGLRARRPDRRSRRQRVGAARGPAPSRRRGQPGRAGGRATIPLRGRRGTIARRMVSSLQTAAQLTSVLELDVKPLVELRAQLNDAGASPRIGITSIVVKLAAAALREHPLLNARVTETEVELLADINVAVAIDTPDGLVAPVVHGADRLSLEEINARIAELARAPATARSRPTTSPAAPSRSRTAASTPSTSRPRSSTRRRPGSSGSAVSATGRSSSATARSPSGRRSRPASPSTIARSTARRPRRSSPRSSRPSPACPGSRHDAGRNRLRDAARLHRTMLTIRLFEQRVAREFRTGEIPGFVHMYVGEEAVAAGVCANLDDDDYVTSTHRGHGHCIAKGCDLGAMMAEIYGREDGLCKGRGGSMHIADFSRGMLGANAIVGGGIALATGAALAASVRGSGQVAVAFFGDGAANQGVLHESLNLAAIWKLPVLYVCENNGFAESTPAAYATSVPDVASRAAGLRHPGRHRRRRRLRAVYAAAAAAVERARAGEGPTLLEVKTYRFMGHFEGDPDRYRDDEERARAAESDALARLREQLARRRRRDGGRARRAAGRDRSRGRRRRRVRAGQPVPRSREIDRYVYPGAGRARRQCDDGRGTAARRLSMVDAIGEAMRQAMEADPAVIVMGEDVVGGAGRGGEKENSMGGSFGATKSLFPLFGPSRSATRRSRRPGSSARASAPPRRACGRWST